MLNQNSDFFEKRSLTSLANCYGSDKGDTYKCAHQYTFIYEKIFEEKLLNHNSPVKLLEIGLNRDNCNSVPSLAMWRTYFGKDARIFGFDNNPEFARFDRIDDNTFIIIGDQSREEDLKKIGQIENAFDIVIDDGYHASKHQQISLLHLWPLVRSGGCYIIEDLHWQPRSESCMKTKTLLEQWSLGNFIGSESISIEAAHDFHNSIEKIELFDSKSTKWLPDSLRNALAILYKK